MALYIFKCANCNKTTEKMVPMASVVTFGEKQPDLECPFCKKNNLIREINNVMGWDSVQEPWQYDYTHAMKPKYVRDSKGNRLKFNPNTMSKGRRGSGR